MSDPIRVGLIRCDTHGACYAALCAGHDPLRLQRPLPIEQEGRYSWQHGGAPGPGDGPRRADLTDP